MLLQIRSQDLLLDPYADVAAAWDISIIKRVFGFDHEWYLIDSWTTPVNIYSHLFGSLLFATLPFYAYFKTNQSYSNARLTDLVVFSTFFFGIAGGFLLSAT